VSVEGLSPSPSRAAPSGPAETPDRPKSRFEPAVRAFLTFCRVECGLAPATLSAYAADLRDLWVYLVKQGRAGWDELTPDDLTRHVHHLHDQNLALATLTRHVATLRVFGRFLAANGYLSENPAERLGRPRTARPLPHILNRQQVEAILNSPQPEDPLYERDLALLELLYSAGLRATELAELTEDALRLDSGIVRARGKGGKERLVPVGRPATQALQQYLTDLRPRLLKTQQERVFLSRTGQPIDRVVVWQIVRRHAHRAGLPEVHPHMLRHSFATDLLAGGADLRIVQELLGHTNVQTTEIYTHVDRTRLKDVLRQFHPRG
jgi:integrase/recombinase XerD